MIPINELIVGAVYGGEGRNFDEGVWTGEEFRGLRFKFGQWIEDGELHWDADPKYGTFRPEVIVAYPDTLYGACLRVQDRWNDFVEVLEEEICELLKRF